MPRQFWNEAVTWNTASGAAIANKTTEDIIFPDVTVFANYMQDGRALRYIAYGQYSHTTGSPTLIFALRWGGVAGTVLATSAACTCISTAVTAANWRIELLINTRTNGSAGTLMANGIVTLFSGVAGTVASVTGEGLVTPMSAGGVLGPAAVTVDLTTDKALSLTAKWSAANALNTLTGLNQLVESLN
jgi:hypothetical protein